METAKQYYYECSIDNKEEPKAKWIPQAGTFNSYFECLEAAKNNKVYPYRIRWVNINRVNNATPTT